MKQIILAILLLTLLHSCSEKDSFSDGQLYKMIEPKKKYDVNIMVLNDSTIALNADSLKTCGWNFIKYSKNKNGAYIIDKEKLDTVWFKVENKKLVMQSSLEKNIFEKVDFNAVKRDSIKSIIYKVQKFANKKIIFSCDINLNEVPYFYDEAIEEIKLNLKNPNTARFNEIYIHEYEEFVHSKFKKTGIKIVSTEVEATNSFGGFTVSTFYVYFVPEVSNKNKYIIKFSDSPIYHVDLLEDEEVIKIDE